jgi:O-antigen/teichoic acid export membrane protein
MRSLGQGDYGVLVVVLAASALSMAVNPAIAATTTKIVSESAGSGQDDPRSLARIITASLSAVAIIDTLLLGATYLFQGPLSALLFGREVVAHNAAVGGILFLALLAVCIQQLDGVFAASIRGLERFRQQALLELSLRLMTTGVVVLVGWRTRDLEPVLLANCAACTASAIVRSAALRGLIPHGRLFARPLASDISRVFSFGSWMWLNAFATAGYSTLDRIIVGRVLGTAAAAEFNVYVQIAQLIHYIPSSLFAFIFPVFSRLSAEVGGKKLITAMYRRYQRLIVATAGIMTAVIIVLHRDLFRAVAGSRAHETHETAFILLTLTFLLLSCNVAAYYLMLGIGRSKQVSVLTTTAMLAALGLTFVLAPVYGLEGAASARFGYGVGTLFLLVWARRFGQDG